MQKNPKWWNKQHESSWERVKAAFKRDWDQTKHDVGGHEPDTHQHIGDTMKQAAGKEGFRRVASQITRRLRMPIVSAMAPASNTASIFPNGTVSLEEQLARDWKDTYAGIQWESRKEAVRRGWEYDEQSGISKAA